MAFFPTLIFYLTISLADQCYCNMYENYSLYEVTAFDARERGILYLIYVKFESVVFLNGVTNEAAIPMDVVVDSCCTKYFENKLRYNNIDYTKIDTGVKKIHYKNDIKQYSKDYPIFHITHAFYTWDSLDSYVNLRTRRYPMIKKIVIGQTLEKRDLYVLRLSNGKKKSALFLMSGEEGRDWLGPAILLNFMEHILEHKFNLDSLIEQYDLYILPILNADGYEFSTNMSSSRFWSKNRRNYFPKTSSCNINESTIGINLSGNWFFSMQPFNGECAPLYNGPNPLSEMETEALSKFLDSIALEMMMFINIRGFQRLITFPYAYTTENCNNYEILTDILTSVHHKLHNKHNTTIFYGPAVQYYYNNSGNVADWVKKTLNTPIVYTIYLKQKGYIFPSAVDIQPMTNELITIIKEIIAAGSNLYDPLFNNHCCYFFNRIIVLNILLAFTFIT